ncbi:uncharacterized protein LOC115753670 isoform X2 [Rhodamnia argentea]|uniref:Uncharacterized protein LOC115753670 isoform X2 n=1 Tax=Rhodamnia argentea TaxID=178133 RepID=A0ABM3HTQ9_9MYRT|nr:uncharacterized protein LOC115753670 isoform X2 [Rhodamnia argentea]
MGETRREMKQSESLQASLPEDIALKIASFLPVGDLCALGSCSRFWREFCGSDVLWESLTRQRWPSLNFSTESSSVDHGDSSSLEGWRDFYVKRHTEMAERAMSVVQHVEQCLFSDSLEIRDYLKAIELLNSMRLGFKDVEMFLFRAEVNVLLNLVGLHYCMHWLEVPAEYVMEALRNSKISQREVCVKWWNLGRLLFNGFGMRDESHCRLVSLQDLALPQDNQVLAVIHRGQFTRSFASRYPYSILLVLPGLSRSSQVCD